MASVATYEGTVENGLIRLRDSIILPDRARVYVVVPDVATEPPARIRTPHLVHPEQAADFTKEVLEVEGDDRV